MAFDNRKILVKPDYVNMKNVTGCKTEDNEIAAFAKEQRDEAKKIIERYNFLYDKENARLYLLADDSYHLIAEDKIAANKIFDFVGFCYNEEYSTEAYLMSYKVKCLAKMAYKCLKVACEAIGCQKTLTKLRSLQLESKILSFES